MHLEPIRLADAPCLLCYTSSPQEAARRGTILYYHGLSANKEANSNEYDVLTRAGFLVVGVDNAGHGERRLEDFDERLRDDRPDFESNFLNLVRETALETPTIINALFTQNIAVEGRLGIAGWSMGGYVTYRALLEERRFSAAAVIVGSPEWLLPWDDSPHKHPQAFFPTALLSQVGARDDVVPAQAARDFHDVLTPYYTSKPERLKLVTYPNMQHDPNAEEAHAIQTEMVAWFERFLG